MGNIIVIVEKEFYHIFNRGVEKRRIFVDNLDRIRFIHDLYEFNDEKHAPDFSRRNSVNDKKKETQRIKLVYLPTFCLMPNHHHLLCAEVKDGGISLFIKKLHGGYARAFNEKHKRSGYLFQGRYKKVRIESDRQLLQEVCYIHANPLNLWRPGWKESRLNSRDIEQAVKFLEKYRWSSHLDYLGRNNFPSVIEKDFMLGVFEEYGGYIKFFMNWLKFFKRANPKVSKRMWDVRRPT